MMQIENFIDTPPLTTDFDIRLIKHRAGRITLRLVARHQVVNIHLGVIGNILDCAARVAGYTTIGNCVLSECEVSIQNQVQTKEFMVSVTIANANQHIATFQCEIQCMVQRLKVLIAESHGTVIKLKTELPIVA